MSDPIIRGGIDGHSLLREARKELAAGPLGWELARQEDDMRCRICGGLLEARVTDLIPYRRIAGTEVPGEI